MTESIGAGRQALGRLGETLAAAHLSDLGYHIVARNWRVRGGEIDLVAQDGETLVFVEVRSRRMGRRAPTPTLGRPEESVTPRKQRQLVAVADAYLFVTPWAGPWRIDVIALIVDPTDRLIDLTHFPDAVGGGV